MNTQEIELCLRQNYFFSQFFRGVYAIDLLPIKKFKRPSSIICNTDNSNGPGVHWVAIWLPKNGKAEYFDSFGIKPLNTEIEIFLKMNGIKYEFNPKQIQSSKSNSCGKFCILFILFRSRKILFKNFLNLFSTDLNYNEKLINQLFNKIYLKY